MRLFNVLEGHLPSKYFSHSLAAHYSAACWASAVATPGVGAQVAGRSFPPTLFVPCLCHTATCTAAPATYAPKRQHPRLTPSALLFLRGVPNMKGPTSLATSTAKDLASSRPKACRTTCSPGTVDSVEVNRSPFQDQRRMLGFFSISFIRAPCHWLRGALDVQRARFVGPSVDFLTFNCNQQRERERVRMPAKSARASPCRTICISTATRRVPCDTSVLAANCPLYTPPPVPHVKSPSPIARGALRLTGSSRVLMNCHRRPETPGVKGLVWNMTTMFEISSTVFYAPASPPPTRICTCLLPCVAI